MCGVFGFVSDQGGRPHLRVLERIASVTERRGPHAFGFAWLDGRGRLHAYRQTGRITRHLGMLAMARDAVLLIGHTRYATTGDPASNINNHPHPCDGGWIVHNGVVSNYSGLLRRLVVQGGLSPSSQCDSEVLGLLIEQADGTLAQRCVRSVRQVAAGPLVLLGLWKSGTMVAVRRGNPLHVGRTGHGAYLASLADGLPGVVHAVADDRAIEFKLGRGTCHAKVHELATQQDLYAAADA